MGTQDIWKMKILGAVLELPAKQRYQFSPFTSNWPNWQCCLAGSSKLTPRILIFQFSFCPGCRISILYEIHWNPCPCIFDTFLSIGTEIFHQEGMGYADYAHHIAPCPPEIENLMTSLNYELRNWRSWFELQHICNSFWQFVYSTY